MVEIRYLWKTCILIDKTYLDWVIWIRNNILSSYNFLLHFARKLLTVKHCYQIHKLNQQGAEIA